MTTYMMNAATSFVDTVMESDETELKENRQKYAELISSIRVNCIVHNVSVITDLHNRSLFWRMN